MEVYMTALGALHYLNLHMSISISIYLPINLYIIMSFTYRYLYEHYMITVYMIEIGMHSVYTVQYVYLSLSAAPA